MLRYTREVLLLLLLLVLGRNFRPTPAPGFSNPPILRLLLHLLIVFKTFVVLFLNSALFCLVDCAHLILAAARPNFFLSKKIATNIL